MLTATYVRPDRVASTSVLEPTAEGYQPVSEMQAVADRFTRIYGPTVGQSVKFAGPQAVAAGPRLVSHAMGPNRPGAVPVTYGFSPAFNRRAQAGLRILQHIGPSAQPPGPYMPARAGARRVAPSEAGLVSKLAKRLTPGPKMVAVRGGANAVQAFWSEGRYY